MNIQIDRWTLYKGHVQFQGVNKESTNNPYKIKVSRSKINSSYIYIYIIKKGINIFPTFFPKIRLHYSLQISDSSDRK